MVYPQVVGGGYNLEKKSRYDIMNFMSENFKKRLKSFAWNLFGLGLVSTLTFLINPETVAELGIPAGVVGVLTLLYNEISKGVNKTWKRN